MLVSLLALRHQHDPLKAPLSLLVLFLGNFQAADKGLPQACASAVLLVVPALEACALDTYVTAIYKHNVVLPEDTEVPVSPEEVLMLMDKNRAILEAAIKEAARQGAHIIVTPEDGIYGWVFTKETNLYLKDVPNPQVD